MLRIRTLEEHIDIDTALERQLFVNAVGYEPSKCGNGWTIVYGSSRSEFVVRCYQFELNTLGLRRI